MSQEEPLPLAGGLETLHLPFASSCRLVRVLGLVAQSGCPTADSKKELYA
jgi:hypothetical protein